MAGTLFGIPLSQPLDINGVPLSGNLLYIYLATTSIPASTFKDFGLTVLNPFPITADSSGRIPPFWLADGTYRARLTTSTGVLVYDIDSIQAIGPSTGTVGGGGGGVDATAVFQTGDPMWVPFDGTRAGWLRLNARTFGSASSGAVERANADTQALYEYCWNNFSNTLCPVTGGRGGTATGDFLANKPMGSLDMRGIGPFGLDTMGNSAAGIIPGGTGAGSSGGGTATITQANLPAANLTYGWATTSFQVGTGATIDLINNNTGNDYIQSIPLGGSGTPLATLSPYRLGTWYMKL